MKSFEYTIRDEAGIHARPAGLLVKRADKFVSDIEVCNSDGKCADAKRLFSVMSLGIKKGETITVKISGEDEDTACIDLIEFFRETL